MIRLSLGWPGRDLHAAGPLSAAGRAIDGGAARRGTSLAIADSLDYGDFAGSVRFRAALADFLFQANGRRFSPEQFFQTAGAGAALDLLCTIFCPRGGDVFVEPASYHFANLIFRDHCLRISEIPVDAS